MPGTFRTRLRIAAKALAGLLSDRSGQEAYGLLSGLYPAIGSLPEKGTLELLQGYNSMPWLRAVAYRVAHAVATTPWQLYRPTRGQREKIVQRTYKYSDRCLVLKQAIDEQRLEPIEQHVLLDALADANSYLVGPSLMFITQIHLDLPGESFWIKERNGLGAPVGFWPIPPNWVRETPTVGHPYYSVQWSAWRGDIPDTEVVWFTEPNPVNPYGRGSGLARALADELETDEYAARHEKMTLLNRARPDLIIWPEETKFDSGQIDEGNARRLAEKWRAEHQGFWRAALPYFATRKLGIQEIGQSFQDLGLTELRKQERDIIIQVFGLPPEQLGIIENSNRATIDTSDFLMKRNVVQPRLDLLRAIMQERLVPDYDERIVIDYVSPVEEDKEFHLKTVTVAPWSITVDEWRHLSGHQPLADGMGEVHMVPSGLTPKADISEPPTPAPSPFPSPLGPGPQATPALPAQREWDPILTACIDAEDVESVAFVKHVLTDDLNELPDLVRQWSKKEPAVRRRLTGQFNDLRTRTSLDELTLALSVHDDATAIRLVLAAVPFGTWMDDVEASSRGWIGEAFIIGARVGGTAAGLQTREPHPIFNRVNPEAVAWAKQRAASTVAGISDATQAGIRAGVVQALELGWHPSKLARVVQTSIGLTDRQTSSVFRFAQKLVDDEVPDDKLYARIERYSDAQRSMRALTIARTELAEAASAGQQRLWDMAIEDGVLEKDAMVKRWIVTEDELLEENCEKLAGEEVPIDATFSNGLQGPPDHPNCRCACGLVTAGGRELAWHKQLKQAVVDGFAGLRASLAASPAPVVNVSVPAAPVHVHVPQKQSERKIVTRDEDGNITSVDVVRYNDDQPRDESGRWTGGGGGGGGSHDSGGTGGGAGGHAGGGHAGSGMSHEQVLAQPSSAYPKANPAGPDSLSQHTRADGSLTPERIALHNAIVESHFTNAVKPEGQPTVIIIGGGPASGKSEVLVPKLGLDKATGQVHIDPDHIKGMLPEYKENIAAGAHAASSFSHEESSIISKKVMARAAAGGFNTTVDGTGDSAADSLQRKISVFRQSGHQVIGQYVTIDTDKAVAFARKRGERTGRYVPESFLRETHAAVSRTFPEAASRGVFDHATVWDNNIKGSPKQIATVRGTKITVHDHEAWNSFLNKGKR